MNKIETIKYDGQQKALYDALQNTVWSIRRLLNEIHGKSEADYIKDFLEFERDVMDKLEYAHDLREGYLKGEAENGK